MEVIVWTFAESRCTGHAGVPVGSVTRATKAAQNRALYGRANGPVDTHCEL